MKEHPQARFVVDTLSRAGFVAYYAGGWVRDFLLGRESDDIDIATNAPPETIQALFAKTVPIGIAFGIILVIVDEHQYEVATFRTDLDYKDGRRPSRVEFTTAIEDARRRDFTINGMFYDPLNNKVLDFVEGKKDLENRLIRAIGNPHLRIAEDRLRMIRAVRLACRFHFTIDAETEEAIRAHASELFPAVAIERIVQELEKGLKSAKVQAMLIRLHEFGLLSTIFPVLKDTSLEEIERRVTPMQHFPKQAPLIAYLLELFPDSTLEEQLNLCKFLKLKSQDAQFVTFSATAKEMDESTELVSWAHFYANPWANIVVEILASHWAKDKKTIFLETHKKRKKILEKAIERIQTQKPIVCAKDLIALGVTPGKRMGRLLREAERLAINEQIEKKEQVLGYLQQHSIWKINPD